MYAKSVLHVLSALYMYNEWFISHKYYIITHHCFTCLQAYSTTRWAPLSIFVSNNTTSHQIIEINNKQNILYGVFRFYVVCFLNYFCKYACILKICNHKLVNNHTIQKHTIIHHILHASGHHCHVFTCVLWAPDYCLC